MLNIFKKNKKDNKVLQTLKSKFIQVELNTFGDQDDPFNLNCNNKEDGSEMTKQESQKARNNDSPTLYKIGQEYYKNKNDEEAFAWYHKAALQNQADAQAQVGDMYRRGQGVSQDYQQAMGWLMKAASAGNAEAQYNIGLLYYCGDGVSVDREQAMKWYLKAANNGYTEAMYRIGFMYRNGKGAPKNIHSAIEWYTNAANQGHEWARYNLGLVYEKYDEVKDLQKAANLFQKAADNSDSRAANKIKELNKQGYYAKEEEQKGILSNAILFFD
jgi:TPR repeat protein